jgi:hypothetical protein
VDPTNNVHGLGNQARLGDVIIRIEPPHNEEHEASGISSAPARARQQIKHRERLPSASEAITSIERKRQTCIQRKSDGFGNHIRQECARMDLSCFMLDPMMHKIPRIQQFFALNSPAKKENHRKWNKWRNTAISIHFTSWRPENPSGRQIQSDAPMDEKNFSGDSFSA